MDMPMNQPVFHGMTEGCEHMAYWAEWHTMVHVKIVALGAQERHISWKVRVVTSRKPCHFLAILGPRVCRRPGKLLLSNVQQSQKDTDTLQKSLHSDQVSPTRKSTLGWLVKPCRLAADFEWTALAPGLAWSRAEDSRRGAQLQML